MLRYYYVTDDLDDLEKVEQELEAEGITEPQIHILSEKDGDVETHRLHEVEPVLKQDVVHSTEIGAVIGTIGAALVLFVAFALGWTESAAGWLPFIFLAVVVLGFCTWEGGFIGIQIPNVNFKRFQNMLHKGRHVFFVDVDPEQEPSFTRVILAHPHLHAVGTGSATPRWVVRWQDIYHNFMKRMP
ncbi:MULTISPECIES: NAD/FAD-utilizing enzyme [Shewanella]|uniref:NAD/FAD-utilizing enzyme n=1 Tax=Shewanella salipaludis TaxID=2723052 RepID=A0A972FVD8_9GAMM|nr:MULTISPECIES: NAD/FAD-utilizing enzyme [Shewanella]MCE9687329.1 NAD/FAD-utilizing enzyme [Shewanella sp. AS16]NMH63958.1 NAD/FAD-utilizing enzyme [Shewanella salipaludis]